MALSGSFTIYTAHETETEIVSSSITYPADLPVGDEYYEFRGQTVITSQSVPTQVENNYNNNYIIIRNISLSRGIVSGSNDDYMLIYDWEAYSSKASKENGDDPNFKDEGAYKWNWDSDSDPFNEAYTELSSSLISTNLINVN